MVFSNSIDMCLVAKCVVHHITQWKLNGKASTNLLLLVLLSSALGAGLLLRLALLQESLGNENIVLGRDGSERSELVRSPTYRGMW